MLPASLDTEAAQMKFEARKKDLEVDLDQQLQMREKLDLQLANNRQACHALKMGECVV